MAISVGLACDRDNRCTITHLFNSRQSILLHLLMTVFSWWGSLIFSYVLRPPFCSAFSRLKIQSRLVPCTLKAERIWMCTYVVSSHTNALCARITHVAHFLQEFFKFSDECAVCRLVRTREKNGARGSLSATNSKVRKFTMPLDGHSVAFAAVSAESLCNITILTWLRGTFRPTQVHRKQTQ